MLQKRKGVRIDMNNRICAFITILVILAILLCSSYHIYSALGYFATKESVTGIGYSILACEVLFFIFPITKFYKMTL